MQLVNKRLPQSSPNIKVYLMEFKTLWRNAGLADDNASANMLINSLNKHWFSKLKNSALFLALPSFNLSSVIHVLQRLDSLVEEERLHAATLPPAPPSVKQPKTRVSKVNVPKEKPKGSKGVPKDVSKMPYQERFMYCYEKGICVCCLSPDHRRPECPCERCVAFRTNKSKPSATYAAAVNSAARPQPPHAPESTAAPDRYTAVVRPANSPIVLNQKTMKSRVSWSDNKRAPVQVVLKNQFALLDPRTPHLRASPLISDTFGQKTDSSGINQFQHLSDKKVCSDMDFRTLSDKHFRTPSGKSNPPKTHTSNNFRTKKDVRTSQPSDTVQRVSSIMSPSEALPQTAPCAPVRPSKVQSVFQTGRGVFNTQETGRESRASSNSVHTSESSCYVPGSIRDTAASVLVDCGSSSNIVSVDIAQHLSTHALAHPIVAEFANGTSSLIEQETIVPLELDGIHHDVPSLVAPIANDLILGNPWIEEHAPVTLNLPEELWYTKDTKHHLLQPKLLKEVLQNQINRRKQKKKTGTMILPITLKELEHCKKSCHIFTVDLKLLSDSPFRIYGDALWPYQCSSSVFRHDEQDLW